VKEEDGGEIEADFDEIRGVDDFESKEEEEAVVGWE
jgi:hypothetical protein